MLVNSIECDVVVRHDRFTTKVTGYLYALLKGIPIVREAFLGDVLQTRSFANALYYIVEDAVSLSQRRKLLHGCTAIVHPSVSSPSKISDYTLLLKALGATLGVAGDSIDLVIYGIANRRRPAHTRNFEKNGFAYVNPTGWRTFRWLKQSILDNKLGVKNIVVTLTARQRRRNQNLNRKERNHQKSMRSQTRITSYPGVLAMKVGDVQLLEPAPKRRKTLSKVELVYKRGKGINGVPPKSHVVVLGFSHKRITGEKHPREIRLLSVTELNPN